MYEEYKKDWNFEHTMMITKSVYKMEEEKDDGWVGCQF